MAADHTVDDLGDGPTAREPAMIRIRAVSDATGETQPAQMASAPG